jgi:hypothetical protein
MKQMNFTKARSTGISHINSIYLVIKNKKRKEKKKNIIKPGAGVS